MHAVKIKELALRLRQQTRDTARRGAVKSARFLRSLARWLAEWAGMQKRIEVIVRNPGLEGTESALGAYHLDFDDAAALEAARNELNSGLFVRSQAGPPMNWAIAIRNEKGDELGFNPEFYVAHRIAEPATLEPWVLPPHGLPPPERENSNG
jgi:hypothetical protein